MMENVCDSRIDTHLVQTVNKSSTRNNANSPAKYVRRQGKTVGGLQSYLANGAARYFKRLKLDYPTTETTRASRRFVRNMKRLSVSLSGCGWCSAPWLTLHYRILSQPRVLSFGNSWICCRRSSFMILQSESQPGRPWHIRGFENLLYPMTEPRPLRFGWSA